MTVIKTFQASGLHCSSCSMLITMAVEELEGVKAVTCNHATGETIVMFEQGVVDDGQIRAAILEAGYAAELVH